MKILKYIVRIVVLAEIIGLATGFYLQNTGQETLGTKFIGFSALGLAFVTMPLFIIYRFQIVFIAFNIFCELHGTLQS